MKSEKEVESEDQIGVKNEQAVDIGIKTLTGSFKKTSFRERKTVGVDHGMSMSALTRTASDYIKDGPSVYKRLLRELLLESDETAKELCQQASADKGEALQAYLKLKYEERNKPRVNLPTILKDRWKNRPKTEQEIAQEKAKEALLKKYGAEGKQEIASPDSRTSTMSTGSPAVTPQAARFLPFNQNSSRFDLGGKRERPQSSNYLHTFPDYNKAKVTSSLANSSTEQGKASAEKEAAPNITAPKVSSSLFKNGVLDLNALPNSIAGLGGSGYLQSNANAGAAGNQRSFMGFNSNTVPLSSNNLNALNLNFGSVLSEQNTSGIGLGNLSNMMNLNNLASFKGLAGMNNSGLNALDLSVANRGMGGSANFPGQNNLSGVNGGLLGSPLSNINGVNSLNANLSNMANMGNLASLNLLNANNNANDSAKGMSSFTNMNASNSMNNLSGMGNNYGGGMAGFQNPSLLNSNLGNNFNLGAMGNLNQLNLGNLAGQLNPMAMNAARFGVGGPNFGYPGAGMNYGNGDDYDEMDDDDMDPKGSGRRWTEEETMLLRQAVEKHGAKNWKKIAMEVPGRNHVQCLQRWRKADDPTVKKGHWSKDEDTKLLELVRENPKNWGHVARGIDGRTAKQCRERYHNHLNPTIKKGDWTLYEDEVILRRQKELGNKWADIAKQLPGRTENSVKIRWKSINRQVVAYEADHKSTTEDATLSPLKDENGLIEKKKRSKRSTMEHDRLLKLVEVWREINTEGYTPRPEIES